jgi:Rrf2 family protein
MQLSRRGDYGLRLVLELALTPPGEFVPAATIAEKQDIPLAFLGKIINQLVVAGLVRTQRGARGGVTLTRSPADISLLDVVEALEGPLLLNTCLRAPGTCQRDIFCPIYTAWGQAQAALVHSLRSITFDTLADQARQLAATQERRDNRGRRSRRPPAATTATRV